MAGITRPRRIACCWVAAALIPLALPAQQQSVTMSGRVSRALRVSSRSRLLVSSTNHRIVIRPADSEMVRVIVETEVSGPQAEVVDLLSSFQPRIRERHGRLSVDATLDRSQRKLLGELEIKGTLTLEIPPGLPVEADSSAAGATLEGDVGSSSVELKADAGNIAVQGAADSIKIETETGSISANVSRSTSTLDITTNSGAVVLQGAGSMADVRTASGSVHLIDLTGPATVRTGNADIEAHWKSVSPGISIDLESSQGAVTLTVPAETPLRATIITPAGQPKSDLPLTEDPDDSSVYRLSPEAGTEAASLRISTAAAVEIFSHKKAPDPQ